MTNTEHIESILHAIGRYEDCDAKRFLLEYYYAYDMHSFEDLWNRAKDIDENGVYPVNIKAKMILGGARGEDLLRTLPSRNKPLPPPAKGIDKLVRGTERRKFLIGGSLYAASLGRAGNTVRKSIWGKDSGQSPGENERDILNELGLACASGWAMSVPSYDQEVHKVIKETFEPALHQYATDEVHLSATPEITR